MAQQQDWLELPEDQLRSAIAALSKQQVGGLWADDSAVQLQFGFQYLTNVSKKLRPKLITVPHQIFPEKVAICLIVRNNCPNNLLMQLKSQLGKVLPLKKLRKNYKDHEERRKLVGRFDLFLYDAAIPANNIAGACGKAFIEKKKNPISIKVTTLEDVRDEIEKVKSSAVYFKSGGVSSTIKVGRSDFTEDQLVENINAVIKRMHNRLDPLSVQNIHIKTPDSISLPLYQCAKQNTKARKIKKTIPKQSREIYIETDEFDSQLDAALRSKNKRAKIFGL